MVDYRPLLALLLSLATGVAVQVLFLTPTTAQIISTPGGIVPSPPPPPPPKIEVPVVPKFDAPPRVNLKPLPQNSFGDRVVRCLDAGAAAGLGPRDRALYSQTCANQ